MDAAEYAAARSVLLGLMSSPPSRMQRARPPHNIGDAPSATPAPAGAAENGWAEEGEEKLVSKGPPIIMSIIGSLAATARPSRRRRSGIIRGMRISAGRRPNSTSTARSLPASARPPTMTATTMALAQTRRWTPTPRPCASGPRRRRRQSGARRGARLPMAMSRPAPPLAPRLAAPGGSRGARASASD